MESACSATTAALLYQEDASSQGPSQVNGLRNASTSGTAKTPNPHLPPTRSCWAYCRSQLQRHSNYLRKSASSLSKKSYSHCALANRIGVPAPGRRKPANRNRSLKLLRHPTHLRPHQLPFQDDPKPLRLKGTLTMHHNHQSTLLLAQKTPLTARRQLTMLPRNRNLSCQRSPRVPIRPPPRYMTRRSHRKFTRAQWIRKLLSHSTNYCHYHLKSGIRYEKQPLTDKSPGWGLQQPPWIIIYWTCSPAWRWTMKPTKRDVKPHNLPLCQLLIKLQSMPSCRRPQDQHLATLNHHLVLSFSMTHMKYISAAPRKTATQVV